MNRRTHGDQFGPRDRIAAFAEATEVYAKGLEDPDLANVYWGKSLGLWQALRILAEEDQSTHGSQLRGPSATGRSVSTRPVVSPAAPASQGR